MPLLFLLYGAVLIDTEPDVGVRPGVKSAVATDGYTPVTDCGGTSLQIIFRGARVVADASQQARAAEGARRRVAWICGQRRRTVPADPGGLVRRL